MVDGSGLPDRIGPYEVTGVLGQGGMGCVYKARHPRTDRVVAIKQLLAGFDAEQKLRFAREAAVLKELEHPGLVRLLDFDVEGDSPYIVFELIEGKSLGAEIVNRAPMPTPRAIDLAIQIAEALASLHGGGLVHRDLKPDNAILRPGDQVVLIDLGIAKHVGEFKRTMDNLTSDGTLLGTAGYFPPEGGMQPDSPAGDCFALGVTLYEMITGTRPFAEAERLGLLTYLDCIREGGYPPASSVNSKVPNGVDAVIARFLEVNPGRRVQDGAEAVRVLTDLSSTALNEKELQEARLRQSTRAHSIPSVSGPAKRASGRTSQPTLRRPSGSHSTVSGRIVAPATPQSNVRASLAAGIVAVTLLAAGFVLVARARTPKVDTPASIASARPATPSVPPGATLTELGRNVRIALNKGRLDLAWLQQFARQRSDLKKDPRTVSAALKQHFGAMGILDPLEDFLPRSKAYFDDESIPASERWSTRSVLCDVELVEYFCGEHAIPWPLSVTVSKCGGALDEGARPWLTDLSGARTWMRWREGIKGVKTLQPIMDRWRVDSSASRGRWLLWFATLEWRSGLVIDVRVNARYRRILRWESPAAVPALRLFAVECDGDREVVRNSELVVLPNDSWDGRRAYLATWLPPELITGDVDVRSQVIDIPRSATRSQEPSLRDRMLTFIPAARTAQ